MNETDINKLDDNFLLERIKSGDEEALDQVIQQHKNMVYATCLRLLKNTADAEDATQATFLILYKKCHKLKKGTVLGGWLYRTAGYVAKQSIRNSVRRKKREEKATIVSDQEDEVEKVWQDLEPELDKALLKLPEKFRDIVVLRYLQGKSTNETAQLLNLSTSAVTTNLSRAVDKLRKLFNRKGIVISSLLLSTTLTNKASAVTLPATSALSVESLVAGGAVSANVVSLMDGAVSEINGFSSKIYASLVALVTVIFVSSGYSLTQKQIDVLGLDDKQVELVNEIFADTRQKYLQVEKKYTTFLIEEDNRVKLKIDPFPEELKALTDKFWVRVDEVFNEYQRKISRRYIDPDPLYSFGRGNIEIELIYDNKVYYYTEKDGDRPGSSVTQDGFMEDWSRFWGDRIKQTGSIFSVSSIQSGMVRKEESLHFKDGQPLVTRDFQETLEISDSQRQRVNKILAEVNLKYIDLEKDYLIFEGIGSNGEELYKVESFSSEKNTLKKSMWNELEKFFNDRQMAIAKAFLIERYTDFMPFGDYEYSVTIKEKGTENYKIDCRYNWWGWEGSSGGSYSKKRLPEYYKRLRALRK